MINVTFVRKQKVAKDIYSFHFASEGPVRYISGQFIELYVPHEGVDDRGIKRWFTLSSSPTESDLMLTTKILPKGASSFKKALNGLKPGADLMVASPMGDFVLPKDDSIPLVFVAGGIGCTPFRSIIKFLADSGQNRDIRLIYSVAHLNDAVFVDLFEKQLGDRFQLTVSSTDGRLDASKILKFSEDNLDYYYYVSGPEPLVESLEASLLEVGVEKSHFLGDYFPGYSTI